MTKIKVSEATNNHLNWLVAKCEGAGLHKDGPYKGLLYWPQRQSDHPLWSLTAPDYCTNWAQGGPIIEREGISVMREFKDWPLPWCADLHESYFVNAPTPLIAAMRCFVASRLGEEVEVPEELV